MPYAIYSRKSEESEERQIQSIEDQLRLNRRRADEHAEAHFGVRHALANGQIRRGV